MKYSIVLFFVFSTSVSHGQVTLEHTYPFSSIRFELVDSNEVKFFYFSGDTVIIFNADHSIYKTVKLPNFGNIQSYRKINFLSRHLFNLDDKLEFLAEAYPNNVAVINEDGEIEFECDGCWGNYPLASGSDAIPLSVVNTQLGTKLILHDSHGTTTVYSLPGKLAGCSTAKSGVDAPSIAGGNSFPTSAYPNPSNGQMRISYKLPLGVSTGELVILSTEGIEVKRYRVGDGFNDILVEKSDLASGSYFYKLVAEKGESEIKRLVILK